MHVTAEQLRWLEAAPIYALAYAFGAVVFWWAAKRRGLATRGMALVMQAGLLGGLIGANLAQLLVTQTPGKTIEGGIVGGWLAVVFVKRVLHIARPTGDMFAFAIPAGEAIGRIGCFVGGCCYGKVAHLPWAVYSDGAWRHPSQLYLALAAAATFAIVCAVDRRARLPENGLFYVQGMLFCVSRFAIEFYRTAHPVFMNLTAAQWGALVGGVLFAALFARLVRPRAYVAPLLRRVAAS